MTDLLNGCRVLIVEDDFLIAEILGDTLREAGATVLGTSATVSGARRLIEDPAARLDVAVLDVNLGEETSYALADDLAAAGIPFIFTSGYGRGALEPRFRERPLCSKPFSFAALCDLVGSVHAGNDR